MSGLHLYLNGCTNALGLAISDGALLSPYREFDGEPTQTLFIYNAATAAQKGVAAEIVPGQTVGESWKGKVRFAISGSLLVEDGKAVASRPDPDAARARNAVGLTADGNSLIFITQNHGEDDDGDPRYTASLPGMAAALISVGANEGLNLDGSGSAQMWFKNNKVEFKSLPSDDANVTGGKGYRPVPVVVGVR